MNITELIARLQELPNQDREVILSKDGEGNGYSPLASLEAMAYRPESTWAGEIGIEKLTDGLEQEGYTEDDVFDMEGDLPAVILWPTN